LANELEHLQEDFQYERGEQNRPLSRHIEDTLQSAVHFQRVLERGGDREHRIRDFRELDRQVHELLSRLSSRNDAWVRRSAARIRYADEQLHYLLTSRDGRPDKVDRELLARLARVLDEESEQLAQSARAFTFRGFRGNDLQPRLVEFAKQAEHFRTSIERDAERDHLRKDFAVLDDQWRNIVQDINNSGYGIYLRRRAQRVNEVQNQLHDLLAARTDRHAPTRVDPAAPPRPPVQQREAERRPNIEFEIPGLGRFQLR